MVLEFKDLFGSNVSTSRGAPGSLSDGCCTREIAVPWKDDWELVEFVLWSILSTAAVVNSSPLSFDGQATLSCSYLTRNE